jgi:hypothetical protein
MAKLGVILPGHFAWSFCLVILPGHFAWSFCLVILPGHFFVGQNAHNPTKWATRQNLTKNSDSAPPF